MMCTYCQSHSRCTALSCHTIPIQLSVTQCTLCCQLVVQSLYSCQSHNEHTAVNHMIHTLSVTQSQYSFQSPHGTYNCQSHNVHSAVSHAVSEQLSITQCTFCCQSHNPCTVASHTMYILLSFSHTVSVQLRVTQCTFYC